MDANKDWTMSAQAETTRDQIKDVALELFSTLGYTKTSLREIAERMGFTKAALYYHFRTKDELLGELVAPMLDAADVLLSDWESDDQAMSLDGSLPWIDRYLSILQLHRDVTPLVASDPSVLSHPGIGDRIRDQGRRLTRLLAWPGSGDRARIRARAVMAVMGVALDVDWADDDLVHEELVHAATAILAGHADLVPA